MFVTVFYAILDVTTGSVTYCNAGHNSPYVMRSNGQVEQLPKSPNSIVGAVEGLTYKDQTFQLEQGDVLLMYTDGITEAMNTQFEEYGDDRLVETLKELPKENCQQLIDSVKESVAVFADGAEQSDDITVMALRRY